MRAATNTSSNVEATYHNLPSGGGAVDAAAEVLRTEQSLHGLSTDDGTAHVPRRRKNDLDDISIHDNHSEKGDTDREEMRRFQDPLCFPFRTVIPRGIPLWKGCCAYVTVRISISVMQITTRVDYYGFRKQY